ncbi:MAG: sporulation integral membrane protein YtvI [Oscillospiraceae bacterium]|nr:sporulation integral membrane protein YtvI [Oscillospiraceae bacterium]
MNDTRTEERRAKIINAFYLLLIVAALYLFLRFAFWLVFPFLFGFAVAVLLQKPKTMLYRKFRMRRGFTSVVLVLLFYIVILLVVGILGARLVTAVKGLTDFLAQITTTENMSKMALSVTQRLSSLLTFLPDAMENGINERLQDFVGSIVAGETAQGEKVGMWNSLISHIDFSFLKTPVSGIISSAAKIPAIAVALVITVVSSFFITSSYESIVHFIKAQLSEKRREALSVSKRIVIHSLGKLLRAYVIIIGVTFLELLLGLYLLSFTSGFNGKNMLGVALITALVDILPILGTGTILVPWALYNLIMGYIPTGIGLLVMYAVIIVVRQVLEPKLVASNLGLPPIVTIAGMYIGLQVLGFVGMFAVPMLVILVKMLNDEGVVRLWKIPEKDPNAAARIHPAIRTRPIRKQRKIWHNTKK